MNWVTSCLRVVLLVSVLALPSCSSSAERTEKIAAHQPVSSAPASTPTAATTPTPLTVPMRASVRWPNVVKEITYVSSADNSRQPAMFFKPGTSEPRPLLVALHSWSADYRQQGTIIFAEWSIANDWISIHPNFRGLNNRPEATGSDLVIKDVLSAVDYAKQNANVDESRIYLVGYSGGGHLALLMAGRAPEVWAGVSAWVPISDLNAWYKQSRRRGTKFASEIEASCGGRPVNGNAAAQECRKRSPLTYLERAQGVPIDIQHGIKDGHYGPVPVSQSLNAFNLLAAPADRLSEAEIAYFTSEAKVPTHLQAKQPYASHGDKKVLFRRQSENVRLTIFDGGHEQNAKAAFYWLNGQAKRGQ